MDVKRSCKRKSNEKERLRSSTYKKKKSGHKKKSRYSDSTETSTDTNSSTSNVEAYKQKHKSVKHISKHKRKKSKHDDLGRTASKKKKHKKKSCEVESSEISQKDIAAVSNNDIGPMPVQASKAMAPMTKEEWEKQQSIVRRVYDPETGRNRLIKGDGEILEEIVSRERHKEINKTATVNDGEYFKAKMGL